MPVVGDLSAMVEFFDLSQTPDDFLGVVPIYKPAGQARGRIFAFHGPGGSWRDTWLEDVTSATGNAPPTFWLQDLLPSKFPNCAIYSVGHHGGWFTEHKKLPGESSFDRRTHEILMTHLESTPLQERALIVFIAHSFGGVYLKSVIAELWDFGPTGDVVDSNAWSRTPQLDKLKGVIFLATPHHIKGELDRYQPLFQNVNLESFKAKYRKDKVDSADKQFRTIARSINLKIVSVSEISQSSVLQKAETRLGGTTADLETVVEAKATHHNLTKYGLHDNARFRDICDWLQKVFEKTLEKDLTWDPVLILPGGKKPSREVSESLLSQLDGTSDRWKSVDRLDSRKDSRERWVHFPANNEVWMNNAMRSMSPSIFGDLDISLSLGTILRARSNIPHSRYVLPRCDFIQKVDDRNGDSRIRCTYFGISLPYLHWETLENARNYSSDIQNAFNSSPGTSVGTKIPCLAPLLSQHFSSYHPRRTLDQFFYSRLKDTRARDEDQVVTRQTMDPSLPGGQRVVMVDQLWLCICVVESAQGRHINWDYHSSDVLTSFPLTSYPRTAEISKTSSKAQKSADFQKTPKSLSYRTGDIRQDVFEKLCKQKTYDPGREKAPHVTADLTLSIISQALFGVLSDQIDWSLNFLELFREAIGDVADSFNEYFQTFNRSLASDAIHNEVNLKREEVRLGIQIADIIDELNMLKHLFETQLQVLERACVRMVECDVDFLSSLRLKLENRIDGIKTIYLQEVTRMIADSERIQQNLMNLLDLQQKEENLYEAQSANQQALFAAKQVLSAQAQVDATNAQSQVIFIFTIVTIFFLPLSFFTSFYGMNILDDNGDGGTNYERSYVYKVMFGASMSIIVALLVGAYMWYRWSKKQSEDSNINYLARLKAEGNLPQDLISRSDRIYGLVEERARYMRPRNKV